MGTLYSRSIAALMSKGEYIFGLDNDDMYFYHDVFDYIYKKGKHEDLDIIGFLTINLWNYIASIKKMRINIRINFILNNLNYQPG